LRGVPKVQGLHHNPGLFHKRMRGSQDSSLPKRKLEQTKHKNLNVQNYKKVFKIHGIPLICELICRKKFLKTGGFQNSIQ